VLHGPTGVLRAAAGYGAGMDDTVTPTSVDFGGLRISYDARVLRPRSWTVAQSQWAAALLAEVPEGPVLELCCGAGQIGLLAVRDSDRELVCVDADPVAAAYARQNAEAAGLGRRVEVREGLLSEAVGDHEQFPLVVADPPWVPRADVGRFPDDPLTAIDGGDDGLAVARECVAVVVGHLAPGGAALLQLGTRAQASALEPLLEGTGIRAGEVREHGERGVLLRLDGS
jgi:methylase of polypeptide subunit release factors